MQYLCHTVPIPGVRLGGGVGNSRAAALPIKLRILLQQQHTLLLHSTPGSHHQLPESSFVITTPNALCFRSFLRSNSRVWRCCWCFLELLDIGVEIVGVKFCFVESLGAMAVVELVEGYRWVVVALIANVVIITWMATRVGAARRKYHVPYPTMYADEKEYKDANAFNCVQRAHQNAVEFSPNFLASLLIGGLQYPHVAGALGIIYGLARIQYFNGYSSGEPSKRFSAGGAIFFPAYFSLVFCSICFALHQFFPNLV